MPKVRPPERHPEPLNSSPSFGVRLLLVVVCALTSIIVATVAGILSYSTGTSIPEAVLLAGGAFAVSMGLGLAILTALNLA
ncbi:hypothetical protein [Streptomyces sp. NPDC048845]|uniref:hypothetical protein n=1 Tax=Streptomyces sp. NPDC048845 TaxID=3155390 RepID=UPI003438C57A